MNLSASVSQQERVNFTKDLFLMLKSGITINEALSLLSEQSGSNGMKQAILRVRDRVIGGTYLSEAFAKERKIFGEVFISLVKAGEKSGTLQENLQFLADWLERNEDLRREVNTAALYPKLVFGASLILGASLAIFILPKLIPLFSQLGTELPLITQILLAIALFVQKQWLFSLVLLFVVFAGAFLLNRVTAVRSRLHLLYLKIPFVGTMLKNYQLAMFSQLFGTLLKSGLTIGDSVPIVSEAVSNMRYKRSIKEIGEKVERGTTFAEAMSADKGLYPSSFISIIATGEKTGNLTAAFSHLSDFYSKEVSTAAKKLPTVIEPVLLIIIAFVVGFIALSIIMPIYRLTGSISQ